MAWEGSRQYLCVESSNRLRCLFNPACNAVGRFLLLLLAIGDELPVKPVATEGVRWYSGSTPHPWLGVMGERAR